MDPEQRSAPTRRQRSNGRLGKCLGGLAGRVAVFSRDLDLLDGLPAYLADELTSTVWVPSITLEAGAWAAPARRPTGITALLVLDGLLTRQVSLGGRASVELLGQGDVLEPWLASPEALPAGVQWQVELPATLAVLDAGFLRAAAPHDSVITAIMDRLLLRSRRLAVQAALGSVSPIEERVLGGLWHVAVRWGKVTSTGVTIPFPLRHRLIAAIVGATRPTVSSALAELGRRGLAERVGDGWVLHDWRTALESADQPSAWLGEPGAPLQRWAGQTGREARTLLDEQARLREAVGETHDARRRGDGGG